MPTLADLAHLEFPRHVHRPSVPGAWVSLIVHDKHECAAALAQGWSLVPIIIGQESSGPPTPAEAPHTADLPEPEPPRKHVGWPKGKPRKVQP
jgi:hypothetical protein